MQAVIFRNCVSDITFLQCLEAVSSHAFAIFGDEPGAFLLGVSGGKEHAFVSRSLFILADTAWLEDCKPILHRF